jgi:hypothetical protein
MNDRIYYEIYKQEYGGLDTTPEFANTIKNFVLFSLCCGGVMFVICLIIVVIKTLIFGE